VPALRLAVTNTRRLDRSPIQRALQPESNDTEAVVHAARAELHSAPILSQRGERLRLLQNRHDRMMSIVDARAAAMAAIPGGSSGLLDSECKLDKALLSELREHEKQASIESGQWNEATANVAIQIVVPVLKSGATPQAPPIDIAVTR
jgi:hypothetical protein